MSICSDLVKSMPGLLVVPGLGPGDVASAICRAVSYTGGADDDPTGAIRRTRTSLYPGLSKAVKGGLEHFISADNPAGYVELWKDGEGTFYGTTGASPDARLMPKAALKKALDEHTVQIGFYPIEGLYKGDSPERATYLFLTQFFPPHLLKSVPGGCNCPAAQRLAQRTA